MMPLQEILSKQQYTALNGLWTRTVTPLKKQNDFNWQDATKTLFYLNIGMEETLHYLYYSKPSFEEFLTWLENLHSLTPIDTNDETTILSADDLLFWEENGYLVIKQAASTAQCNAVKNAIWDFLDATPDDEKSWYKFHPDKKGLMLAFSQHEALKSIRNIALIRKVYEELYKSKAIYKTVDKVSFNPPETANYSFLGSKLHWDVSLALPIPFKLQGLLYLNDVTADGGPFQCVPGFHHQIGDWISSLPENINIRDYASQHLKPISITGSAGDFIIWHQALPHCASPNRSKTPRMVQYLTYLPENLKEQDVWI